MTDSQLLPNSRSEIFFDLSKQAGAKIASRFISNGGGFATHVFLGRLGITTLAAGALITTITRQLSSFIVGVLSNASIQMNSKLNTDEPESVGEQYQQSLLVGTILSMPAIAFMVFSGSILPLLGQPAEVASVVQQYFRAFVWGMAPSLWTFTAQQLAVGLKKPLVVLASGIFQSVGIVLLSYPFMFGKLGFPNLGVAGLGYALSLVSLLNFIGLSFYFYWQGYAKQYHLYGINRQGIYPFLKGTWNVFKKGFSVGVQVTSELLMLLGLTLLAGINGKIALAATQVALQYLILMIIPLSNGAQVAGILVGQAVQQEQPVVAQRYGNLGIVFGTTLATLFSITLFSAAPALSQLFIDSSDPHHESIHSLAVKLLFYTAATQLPDTVRYFCVSALRGLSDVNFAMVVSLACVLALTLGLGAIFDFVLRMGVTGLFLGHLMGISLGTGLMAWRWHQKSSHLVADEEALDNCFTGCLSFFKKRSASQAVSEETLLLSGEQESQSLKQIN